MARTCPSRHLASAAADGGGMLRCNSGQDGRTGTFLGCAGLTRQPKYNLFRGAALRHLVSVRAVKLFQHSNP